jgi:hypothetical protein
MPTEQNSKLTILVDLDHASVDQEAARFVTVAIPENLGQSKNLKADLEAYDIPVHLQVEEAEMDADLLGGVPVLVPEGVFERASEIVGLIELNALEDDDDFEEDEEEEEEAEGGEEEEWDDEEEEYDEDEEEEEEEEEEPAEDDDFDLDDFDELDDDEDLDEEP